MKTCFKCGRTLPLGEFYRHPQMADGHLGKCKDCTRSDVRANRSVRLDQYRAYDRKRRPRTRPEYDRPWRQRNPEKYAAHRAVGNAVRAGAIVRRPCEVCGNPKSEAHHDDYSAWWLVQWLCKPHHVMADKRRRSRMA